MGCCFTKPSPLSAEEPIVKEILPQQIPRSKPLADENDDRQNTTAAAVSKLIPMPLKYPTDVQKLQKIPIKEPFVKEVNQGESTTDADAASQVSEMCSFSESVVTDGEVRKKPTVKDISPPSIVRRSNSLTRRQQNAAAVTTGQSVSSKRGSPSPRRVRSGSDSGKIAGGLNRHEIGEMPGRRSRSPAVTRRPDVGGGCRSGAGIVGRSRSARISRRFPSPVPAAGDENRTIKAAEVVRCGGEESEAAETESLDNPIVSLECFIFL